MCNTHCNLQSSRLEYSLCLPPTPPSPSNLSRIHKHIHTLWLCDISLAQKVWKICTMPAWETCAYVIHMLHICTCCSQQFMIIINTFEILLLASWWPSSKSWALLIDFRNQSQNRCCQDRLAEAYLAVSLTSTICTCSLTATREQHKCQKQFMIEISRQQFDTALNFSKHCAKMSKETLEF